MLSPRVKVERRCSQCVRFVIIADALDSLFIFQFRHAIDLRRKGLGRTLSTGWIDASGW